MKRHGGKSQNGMLSYYLLIFLAELPMITSFAMCKSLIINTLSHLSHLSHLKRTLPRLYILFYFILKKNIRQRSVTSVTTCLKSMGYRGSKCDTKLLQIVTILYNQALSSKEV